MWIAAAAGIITLAAIVTPVSAADASPVALSGQVTAMPQGAMEGVLVSAQKAGSSITITVVSDHNGHFAFPATKLSAGHYSLRIRALGYELDGPAAVDVPTSGGAAVDVTLRPAADLAAQLTNTEWFMSMPGAAEQLRPLIECMSCHTLERILRSTYDADQWVSVLKRMANYANNTTMAHVQSRIVEREVKDDRARQVADYLATVNLSKGAWSYELKTLPRPNGRASRVVITEYDLPRASIAPHDVRTDGDGMVWYSNFVEPFLGRLDPRTGEHSEYPYPVLKPGFPTGSLALEPDQAGNFWLATMFQGGLAKFDVRSKRFQMFAVQAGLNTDATQQSMVMPWQSGVDGKVWTNDVSTRTILRLDVQTGKYASFDPFQASKARQHSPYGMAADADNNLYFMDFGDEAVGKVDAKTGKTTLYPTPTPRSRPRRTMLDRQGRLWFAEFAANKLAMFDLKEEAFKEWDAPTPHTYPYDVFLDRNGELWSGSMSSDRVLRFDPQTGKSVEYLLPRPTNIRRIFIDNSTTPVTFWAGSNHGASIIKLEPLD